MFKPNGIITVITDFGMADGYTAVMEGVILTRFRDARVVRITDSIPPQDVRSAAWVLMNSAPSFPEGTLHLVVVDPGVGTDRKIALLLAGGHLVLCPDNGVASYLLKKLSPTEARALRNLGFALPEVSSTFHGRDIFAPAAAALLSGAMTFEETGDRFEPVRIDFPEPEKRPGEIWGEAIYIDAFGNIITNVPFSEVLGKPCLKIHLRGALIDGVSGTYTSSGRKEIVANPDSSGYLSVSRPFGSAADFLGVERGEKMRIEW